MKKKLDIKECKELLYNVLKQYSNLEDVILHEMVANFELEVFPKNSVIIPKNCTNNKLFFVINGLVRIYYEAEGKEITYDFKEENSFFTNGYTIFTKLPNFDLHVAIEHTVCLSANYDKMEAIMEKYHQVEHLGRKMVELYYANYLIANYNKMFLSAVERYELFAKDHSSLMLRLPLRYVASYLGIAPETLSRLRSKY